tara:strand:- start:3228 stop:3431 length:204 start_codon:yes stop_codon:yes gene_type:complete
MKLTEKLFEGWVICREKTTHYVDVKVTFAGYKDIRTFYGTERITTPNFTRLAELQNWIRNYNNHHVR